MELELDHIRARYMEVVEVEEVAYIPNMGKLRLRL